MLYVIGWYLTAFLMLYGAVLVGLWAKSKLGRYKKLRQRAHQRAQRSWTGLVDTIISKKRWSEKRRAQNYAKRMLALLDHGPPRGFGKHLGRWGWREISSSW